MYLLNTNHCSLAILANPNVLSHLAAIENSLVSTCVIVQGELVDMAERSQNIENNLAIINNFMKGIQIHNIDEFTKKGRGQRAGGRRNTGLCPLPRPFPEGVPAG
jgi:tRNA(fMet)-specific endonuclease VapC